MSDDSSQEDFERYLKKMGWAYEVRQDGDKRIFRVDNYVIPHGKYAGKIVSIGFPMPKDFPTTAPYGIHVKANGVFTEQVPRLNPSCLGSEWHFWSRQIHNWQTGRRNSQYYIDNVNRWLEIA